MSADKVISILNNLIRCCRDNEAAIRMCRADIGDQSLRDILADRESSFAAAANVLQNLVFTRGGEPETSGSVSGGLLRDWFDLKTALFGKTDNLLWIECERSQDAALHCYSRTLEWDLPTNVRTFVANQLENLACAQHARLRFHGSNVGVQPRR